MAEPAPPPPKPAKSGKTTFRSLSRALHRDLGHLAVGLTFVYALSGLAVNHILDWEPSFVSYQEAHELGGPLTGSDDEIAKSVLAKMAITAPARDVYRAAPDELQITLDKRTLHVTPATGHVLDEGQRPRFFLRVANWLHLNRGKKAWTYIADTYAVGLLLLALSGIVLNTGRKGLLGRGGILILAGAAVPVLYVVLSGGPEQKSGRPAMSAPP
ncbi:MAG: hypothetical protein U0359_27930 [Byssovorax sp.]